MKAFVPTCLAAATIATGAGAATPAAGLHGTVTRGPITPVCTAEQPCSEPAAGAVLRFTSARGGVWRTVVHADGSYRIALAPGPYAVSTTSHRPVHPASVRVVTGRVRHIDLAIDTGIR